MRLLALFLLVACATTEPVRRETPCPACPACPPQKTLCDQCVAVCGEGNVRRCSRAGYNGEENCECKP